jgi:hypothetical protein
VKLFLVMGTIEECFGVCTLSEGAMRRVYIARFHRGK